MSNGEEKWLIAVCGLNCVRCFMYYRRDENDLDVQKEIQETIKWFREEKNLYLSNKDLICKGCLGPLDGHWSPNCGMMLCAREKGLKHCFECKDFPCASVEKFAADEWEHHRKAVENSKRMRKIGLETWIAEKEAET